MSTISAPMSLAVILLPAVLAWPMPTPVGLRGGVQYSAVRERDRESGYVGAQLEGSLEFGACGAIPLEKKAALQGVEGDGHLLSKEGNEINNTATGRVHDREAR
ncbi:hypothetical protein LY76DRAFT_101512 [Colletotrichum caudatum]|nr:hypothetical protein LY76DRAFT_101512 [Colletotrichum caudatum]